MQVFLINGGKKLTLSYQNTKKIWMWSHRSHLLYTSECTETHLNCLLCVFERQKHPWRLQGAEEHLSLILKECPEISIKQTTCQQGECHVKQAAKRKKKKSLNISDLHQSSAVYQIKKKTSDQVRLWYESVLRLELRHQRTAQLARNDPLEVECTVFPYKLCWLFLQDLWAITTKYRFFFFFFLQHVRPFWMLSFLKSRVLFNLNYLKMVSWIEKKGPKIDPKRLSDLILPIAPTSRQLQMHWKQRRSKTDQEKTEQWQNICFPYVAGVCENPWWLSTRIPFLAIKVWQYSETELGPPTGQTLAVWCLLSGAEKNARTCTSQQRSINAWLNAGEQPPLDRKQLLTCTSRTKVAHCKTATGKF